VSSRKHLRELVDLAGQLGFTLAHTRGGHVVFLKPGRQPVYAGSTPSDRRALANVRAQLVRTEREAMR
jgi:hypothetical protein